MCLYSLLNKAHTGTFQSLSDIRNSVPLPVLEFHRKQRFRVTTAANSSTAPAKYGAKRRSSPSPAQETARKTTTASLNKKTAPWFVNTQAMTGWKDLRNRPSWPPSASRWFRCLTSSCPPKNAQTKRGWDPKKSKFTTSPKARSKGSPRTSPAAEVQGYAQCQARALQPG
jgi:hypothetical protein